MLETHTQNYLVESQGFEPWSGEGNHRLNSKGEVIGILDSKTSEKAHGNTVFIIPIKDALEDLNLKLE